MDRKWITLALVLLMALSGAERCCALVRVTPDQLHSAERVDPALPAPAWQARTTAEAEYCRPNVDSIRFNTRGLVQFVCDPPRSLALVSLPNPWHSPWDTSLHSEHVKLQV